LPSFYLETPAKLNLGLRIGNRRDDGYHDIQTIFQTIDLRDGLALSRSSTGNDELDVRGPVDQVPSDRDNLVLKILRELRSRGVTIPPLDLTLKKRVPPGSGLGGGSSNAAGLLRILSERNPEKFNRNLITEVAAEVGSDVPFFLEGGTVEARGRGEQLRSRDDLSGVALVAIPPYSVQSGWAYRALDERRSDRRVSPEGIRGDTWNGIDLSNDFESVIAERYPLHDELRNRLEDGADAVSLSGSGSALYGLFGSIGEARSSREELDNAFEGTDFHVAEFLGKDDITVMERKASCRSK
jgi:4-diphosphocytidyl-2-C-methyl-D-erythritol kinase